MFVDDFNIWELVKTHYCNIDPYSYYRIFQNQLFLEWCLKKY